MTEQNELYDITIIGGGPSGLFAAFYAGLRQMKVKIIESMPQLGGQLGALYPEKFIYDVAGFPKVSARELVDRLKEQAFQFDPSVVLEQTVETLVRTEDQNIVLTSTSGEQHYTKTVVITAGVGAFQPRRLEAETALVYEGQNLHYFVDNMNEFAGQKVLVCGGGDSAVDWANMLDSIASEVTLIHRRDVFRAHEHSVAQLKNSDVKIKTPYQVKELIGDGKRVSKVTLEQIKGDDLVEMDVDAVIVNYGFVSSLGPIKDWGIEIVKNSILVNTKMETNIPGVYAAGDVCTYDGKVKLIASGFGEAPTAVNNAKHYLDPKSRTQPMHSTSMFG